MQSRWPIISERGQYWEENRGWCERIATEALGYSGEEERLPSGCEISKLGSQRQAGKGLEGQGGTAGGEAPRRCAWQSWSREDREAGGGTDKERGQKKKLGFLSKCHVKPSDGFKQG